MSADTPQIGDIVRNARRGKDLSQSALAELIGTSKQTIYSVENNLGWPSFVVLCGLVRSLTIPSDWIFYPHRASCTLEEQQSYRELMSCNEYELNVLLCLLRALRHDVPEKQG